MRTLCSHHESHTLALREYGGVSFVCMHELCVEWVSVHMCERVSVCTRTGTEQGS